MNIEYLEFLFWLAEQEPIVEAEYEHLKRAKSTPQPQGTAWTLCMVCSCEMILPKAADFICAFCKMESHEKRGN
jgi:hypothetical protein